MSKPLTKFQIKKIIEIIREWPTAEKFTWENICKASEFSVGFKPTRQTLYHKEEILNAYNAKKAQIRGDASERFSGQPKTYKLALVKLKELTEENNLLKTEISQMAEIASRFIHNASLHGLTKEQLMKDFTRKIRNHN